METGKLLSMFCYEGKEKEKKKKKKKKKKAQLTTVL